MIRTLGALALAGFAWAIPAAAADPLSVELNRLEEREGSCRIYLVIGNKSATAYESLKLDLVLFGTDGVIVRRLAVEAAPLRADKTSVKLFDVSGLACTGIGNVLLNDVLECRGATGDEADCIARIVPSSRAANVALSK